MAATEKAAIAAGLQEALRVLVEVGLISGEERDAAIRLDPHDPLRWLAQNGGPTLAEQLPAIAKPFALEVADLTTSEPSNAALAHLPAERAKALRILPLNVTPDTLTVAVDDPLTLHALDELAHVTGKHLEPQLTAPSLLTGALERAYPQTSWDPRLADEAAHAAAAATAELREGMPFTHVAHPTSDVPEAPLIRYVDQLMAEAIRRRASDIHLEPMARRFRVRFRIDGRLQEVESPPKPLQPSIISRLKLMADLSIAEKRRPQDGRMQLTAQGKDLDLRVSCLPSVFGESIVMRVLDKEGLKLGLSELGFLPDDEALFRQHIAAPDGMFLVTGPTGSGKSTTLYSALHHLNQTDRKIITVEDPVEYQLAGINQVQVRREVGMTFAHALRAMLRQAPNIIMVGEIRDAETADIAIQAALTGHMVFSTLHTNDAPSAVTRLIDIGVKPFLVAAALRAVMAQRLVRRVCEACAEPHTLTVAEQAALGLTSVPPDATPRRGAGCIRCGGKGYDGRLGIFEIFSIDDGIRELIHQPASLVTLRRATLASGMHTMRQDGLRKILTGLTTPAEVLRVTMGG